MVRVPHLLRADDRRLGATPNNQSGQAAVEMLAEGLATQSELSWLAAIVLFSLPA
jgi:hypothetical protein